MDESSAAGLLVEASFVTTREYSPGEERDFRVRVRGVVSEAGVSLTPVSAVVRDDSGRWIQAPGHDEVRRDPDGEEARLARDALVSAADEALWIVERAKAILLRRELLSAMAALTQKAKHDRLACILRRHVAATHLESLRLPSETPRGANHTWPRSKK